MQFQNNNSNLGEVEKLIRAGGTAGVGSGGSRSKGTPTSRPSAFDQIMTPAGSGQGSRSEQRWILLACLVAVVFIVHMMTGETDIPKKFPGSTGELEFVDPEAPTSSPQDVDDETLDSQNDNGDQIVVVETSETDPPTNSPTISKPKPRNSKIPLLEPDKEAGPISEDKMSKLSEKWGSWHFWDGDVEMRPKEDYLSQYPNRDIPGDNFPSSSWQVDSVYVNHFLNDADHLLDRAMESIFSEYGHGKPLPPEELAARFRMFHWEKIDLSTATEPPPEFKKRGSRDIGGWTTKRSFDGLVRRLLHAMLTQDTFTVVVAGHSAAQGQGNHFRQSYAMQFHRIMKPIFERLGVKLITRNASQGGLGTLQGGMGARDIYGSEIDLFLWDSGMTESNLPHHIDLVIRQVLLSGNRVPIIWGGPFDLLKLYHELADVDVGDWGNGLAGIPETTSEEQALTLPYAARNMKCSSQRHDLCDDNRFSSTCWIERPDGIVPTQTQLSRPRGQVKWHPGWRAHQLMGRVLAFSVMEGLESAVNFWMQNTMTGQPLDDQHWHITEYYENIRSKLRDMDRSTGRCPEIAKNGELPLRICFTPLNARTQYTPRAKYIESSLTSIVKPAPSGYKPIAGNLRPALYEGPDVHNPAYDIPEGEIDVLSIIMGRRRLDASNTMSMPESANLRTRMNSLEISSNSTEQTSLFPLRRLEEEIVPGEGWDVALEVQGFCDGSYDAVCAHSPDEECFLLGHHDGRGAIVGGDLSGWLVLTLDALKEGIIIVKLHTWHVQDENPRARDWTTVNGKRRRLGEAARSNKESFDESEEYLEYLNDIALSDADADAVVASEQHRRAKNRSYACPPLPDAFLFDYAINGKITSLNSTEFLSRRKQLQRVVETMTLLDDPEFTKEEQNVEIAFRLRNAGRPIVFGISHIYWA